MNPVFLKIGPIELHYYGLMYAIAFFVGISLGKKIAKERNFDLDLVENYAFVAIISGLIAGVLTSLLSILVMSILFHLKHEYYVSMLPKSITTAIGIGISEELGGISTITTAVIIVTGVFGNVMADIVYKIFNITNPIAKGIGLGASAHAIGTSKALEMGATEGAMSSLSIAVAGIITVIFASFFAKIM